MPTILVTGASGFVGRYLVPAVLQALPDVSLHAWCFHTPGDFPETVHITMVDLLDFEHVQNELSRIKPDIIFHLAGQANVAKSFVEPMLTFQQNTQVTLNLLEACRLVSSKTTFFLVSSGDVYGKASGKGLLTEETIPEPLNFYATSKLCAEMITQAYHRDFGIKTVILRPFNHIGVGQLPSYAISAFAKQIAEIEQGLIPPVLTVGNIEVERDILSIEDVISAYVALMEKYSELKGGSIIHICSGVSQSIAGLLEKLLAMSHVSVEVQVDTDKIRVNDITRVAASNQKLRTLCPKWCPTNNLTPVLQEVLDYFRTKKTSD